MDILIVRNFGSSHFEAADAEMEFRKEPFMDELMMSKETSPEITSTEAAAILNCSYWSFRRQYAPKLESRKLYGNSGPLLFQRVQVLALNEKIQQELI